MLLSWRTPPSLLLVLLLSSQKTGLAQFSCTLSANDEPSCINTKGDDGRHCAWCSVSSFGFCVSEAQAESMEANIPGVQCDRYSSDDDDNNVTDDDATANDDAKNDDDAAPAPSDDALPPDYWTCLKKKDAQSCTAEGCTWCDSKGGFGLCLTGPSADMANDSAWFTCTKNVPEENVAHPYDTSCVKAYLENPTEKDCTSTTDEDGGACFWCDLQGMANLCLSQEQADMAFALGITCEEQETIVQLGGHEPQKDPYDTSCLMAYLQDPTADGCTSAVDADGQACEYCSFQGNLNLCLTQEQAEMGEKIGITCDSGKNTIEDPYDPTCALAYLQDQSEEACKSAVDSDGNPCEYCTLQGAMNFCLNEEQAETGEQFGLECDGSAAVVVPVVDPYDPTCALAYLQDQSEEACKSAVDSDDNPCEYCTLQGSMNFCLNEEQAEMGEQFGFECDGSGAIAVPVADPYDPTCALAYLQDQSEESCKSAVDSDGNPCEYCTLQGAINLCLNEEQAQMGEQLGIECISSSPGPLAFPSDFWDCLENYDENSCDTNSCTWCNAEVGVGFCVADAVADAMQECNFFDCNYKTEPSPVEKPFDPACLRGMESREACQSTIDTSDDACVWCDGAGVFGLCLSNVGAQAAGEYMTCDVARIA